MEYITGKREEGCIFCTKPPQRDRLKENYILHLGRHAFVILNRFPYHTGHLMVIPLRHTHEFEGLTFEEHAELCVLLQTSLRALKQVYKAEGFNLGMNLGQCAGAGIREHLHYHVVPRWTGDTNFFPTIAQTRSMPEILEQTYERLRPCYRALEAEGVLAPGGHALLEGNP